MVAVSVVMLKVSVVLVDVAAADIVAEVVLATAVIVAPAGMPVPEICAPTSVATMKKPVV